jgi:hypothetical protein
MKEQDFSYRNLSAGIPGNKYKIRAIDSYGR